MFEALVLADGSVVDALPSHTSKAEELCQKKLAITKHALWKRCPAEYRSKYLEWLLGVCGAISVWGNFYALGIDRELTKEQYKTLRNLKMKGLFKGAVTRWRL